MTTVSHLLAFGTLLGLVFSSPVDPVQRKGLRDRADKTWPSNPWIVIGEPTVGPFVPDPIRPGGADSPDGPYDEEASSTNSRMPYNPGGPMIPAGPPSDDDGDDNNSNDDDGDDNDDDDDGGSPVATPTSMIFNPGGTMVPAPTPMPFNPGGPMKPPRPVHTDDSMDSVISVDSVATPTASPDCTYTMSITASMTPCNWNGVFTRYTSTVTDTDRVPCHGCAHVAVAGFADRKRPCADMGHIVSTTTTATTPTTSYVTVCEATGAMHTMV